MATFGKIGAMPMLFRRRTADEYVQSGLVALWDGIENAGWGIHSNNTTSWINLIDTTFSIPMTQMLANGASWSSNGLNTLVNDAKSTAYGWYGWYNNANWLGRFGNENTIELVAVMTQFPTEESGTRDILATNVGGNPIIAISHLYFRGNNKIVGETSGWKTPGPAGTTITIGIPFSRTNIVGRYSGYIPEEYMNGIFVGNSATRTDNAATTGYFAFNTNPWGKAGMTGTYYCIRLYNRALTAEEVAYNYNIDKIRFNLP